MTKVVLKGSFPFPRPPVSASGSPSYATGLLNDAAGEKSAFIFQAPKTGNIDRIGFRTGTVATGGTLDVRIETFDTSIGEPTGTLWGTNTNGSQAVSSTDDNLWFETTLTSSATVTEGDIIAIVLAPSGASFSMTFASYADDLSIGFPEAMLYTTSWSYYSGGAPVMSIRYDDGTYPAISGVFPFSAINTHTFNSGSTPDVYANKFTPTFNCSISGVWIWGDFDGDANIKIYSSDGVTVLASGNIYANVPKTTVQSINIVNFTEIDITAGTTYYVGVEASTGTSLTLYSYEATNSDVMQQFSLSEYFIYTTAKDPTGTGSWTDNAARQMAMGVMISAVDDGAGGGGGGGTRSVIY